ncbi:hypothetical protein [Enterobacter ludwigii]|uniref:hypothetical protein n=1 Tax=Enterobacter ludwigii TaxID=299767 RepID=UPI003F71B16D
MIAEANDECARIRYAFIEHNDMGPERIVEIDIRHPEFPFMSAEEAGRRMDLNNARYMRPWMSRGGKGLLSDHHNANKQWLSQQVDDERRFNWNVNVVMGVFVGVYILSVFGVVAFLRWREPG